MAIKCFRKTEAKVRPVVTNFFTRTPYSRSLDVWRDSLCSYFRYHLSHFFLSPAVIQWINKWVYHGTCQHRCFSDRANIIKVWSSNDKTETKWKKVNNNSTNYQHSYLRSSVLFDKPAHFFLDNSKEYFSWPVLSFMSVKKRPVNWPWFTQWWQWRNRGKNTCLKAHGTEPN